MALTSVTLNSSPSWTVVTLNSSPSFTQVALNTSPSWTIPNSWKDSNIGWTNETRTWKQIGLLGKDSD